MPKKISNFVFINSRYKTMSNNKCFILTAMALLLSACGMEEEGGAETRAKSFAQDYFNLRYRQAASQCSPGAAKWVEYQASNVSQADLDVLNAQQDTALCEVDDVDVDGDKAVARITVSHFLLCDSIGKPGTMRDKASFDVALKRDADKWLVDINAPLTPIDDKKD